MEAAARNAAEAAAQEYQQVLRNNPVPLPADYARIHDVALEELCDEAKVLPNRAVDVLGNCTMPITAVCVHDQSGGDSALCGEAGASPVPSECSLIDGWKLAANPLDLAPGPDGLPYVEVRTCYQFTTLFNLHLQLPFGASLSLGDIWMQRERHFAVGNY